MYCKPPRSLRRHFYCFGKTLYMVRTNEKQAAFSLAPFLLFRRTYCIETITSPCRTYRIEKIMVRMVLKREPHDKQAAVYLAPLLGSFGDTIMVQYVLHWNENFSVPYVSKEESKEKIERKGKERKKEAANVTKNKYKSQSNYKQSTLLLTFHFLVEFLVTNILFIFVLYILFIIYYK